ncbi:DEAD/DEAH box helicase [Formosa agariphila KMM 3901]|uniref:DEAD/DEAH box helicase n=1 Tax=Formosa agariphila (strain DSM 15362 / KCTC 12365 / LMG 23005 / KMM 3901 / M-2Alg 35-1) TaxID=1347342 RepID=T2KHZ6_FORAG|nr:DEAD/DEAH box helicase [Formosa agariphila]CDF78420.1 DEAD/DEAH box helicase [Formosa agariphila KMM 3901]
MSFKKILPVLKETLDHLEFDGPTPLQKKVLSTIKSGANVFGIGAEGSGKSTAIVLSVIQKLKGEAVGDAPRAIVLVKDKAEALALKEKFEVFSSGTDLRVYCIYDEHKIEAQRDEIYVGTDILIATVKRLNKLYFLNSIHLADVQLICIEDAQFLIRQKTYDEVCRLAESVDKCQYVVFADAFDSRLTRFEEAFMFDAYKFKV